jgi:hypothetical protein
VEVACHVHHLIESGTDAPRTTLRSGRRPRQDLTLSTPALTVVPPRRRGRLELALALALAVLHLVADSFFAGSVAVDDVEDLTSGPRNLTCHLVIEFLALEASGECGDDITVLDIPQVVLHLGEVLAVLLEDQTFVLGAELQVLLIPMLVVGTLEVVDEQDLEVFPVLDVVLR